MWGEFSRPSSRSLLCRSAYWSMRPHRLRANSGSIRRNFLGNFCHAPDSRDVHAFRFRLPGGFCAIIRLHRLSDRCLIRLNCLNSGKKRLMNPYFADLHHGRTKADLVLTRPKHRPQKIDDCTGNKEHEIRLFKLDILEF